MSKRLNDNKDSPRSGRARAAGELIGDVGGQSFRRFGFVQHSIVSRWGEIVGERYAKVSCPESIKFPAGKKAGGVLTLLVDGAVQFYGGEAIRRNGKVLGVTSSARWGHTIGKAVAFGYVAAEEAGHADYEIEAFTRRHAAQRLDGAAVDPHRTKILV